MTTADALPKILWRCCLRWNGRSEETRATMKVPFQRLILLAVLMAVGAGRTLTQDLKDPGSRNRPSLEQTKVILISQYMQRTGNEAMLITDPDKVNELVKLFS